MEIPFAGWSSMDGRHCKKALRKSREQLYQNVSGGDTPRRDGSLVHDLIFTDFFHLESAVGVLVDGFVCSCRKYTLYTGPTLQQAGDGADDETNVNALIQKL